jgi:hypothetical protein
LEATLVELLAVEQLAQLIHKTPASIRSDASRNPGVLPPICRLPGNKRLLWRRTDVLEWVAQHVDRASATASPWVETPALSGPRKRGRPRKVA